MAPNGHGSEGQEVGRSCVLKWESCACGSEICIGMSLRRQQPSSHHAWKREFELLFANLWANMRGNGRPAV